MTAPGDSACTLTDTQMQRSSNKINSLKSMVQKCKQFNEIHLCTARNRLTDDHMACLGPAAQEHVQTSYESRELAARKPLKAKASYRQRTHRRPHQEDRSIWALRLAKGHNNFLHMHFGVCYNIFEAPDGEARLNWFRITVTMYIKCNGRYVI